MIFFNEACASKSTCLTPVSLLVFSCLTIHSNRFDLSIVQKYFWTKKNTLQNFNQSARKLEHYVSLAYAWMRFKLNSSYGLRWSENEKKQQQIGLLYTYDEGIKDPRNI